MQENMVVVREPKTFDSDFDWPKNVDKNLKHGTEFTIKSYETLAENKIKNEIEQLLLKYKHGNNIHEHRKSEVLLQYSCEATLLKSLFGMGVLL